MKLLIVTLLLAISYAQTETALASLDVKMVLMSRQNECDWDGVDSSNGLSLGGKGHTSAECKSACQNRALCNFASISSDGYCHLFETCNGEGSNGWKVYYKETRPEYLTDGYGLTTNGDGCDSGRIIDEATCKTATAQLGGTYGKAYNLRDDQPGCYFADDGRSLVYFNTDLKAAGSNPKYAEICESSYCHAKRNGLCADTQALNIVRIFIDAGTSEEKCFEECAKYAATDGEGCCHYGPETIYNIYGPNKCMFNIGDGLKEISRTGLDDYESKVRVGICGPSAAPPPPRVGAVNCEGYLNFADLPADWCDKIDRWSMCGIGDGTIHGEGSNCKFDAYGEGYCKDPASNNECTAFLDSKTDFAMAIEVNQVIGATQNAVLIFAAIGAMSAIYHGAKGVQKVLFTTNEFQKL